MAVGSRRYRIVYFGPPLGSRVSDGHSVTVPAVAKKNGPNAPYCVPNEVLCGELGRLLGLPVPPGGVFYAPDGNRLFYASLNFNLTGVALPPVDTTKCTKLLPRASTGVLLFDVLIANADRDGRNFSVDFSLKPPTMNIFDHGHAMFGKEAGKGVARLQKLQTRLGISAGSQTMGNRHCLLDQIATDNDFGYWLDRIRCIPDFFIEDVCQELGGLGCSDGEVAAAIDFLRYRRTNLQQIIESNQDEFTGIRSWALFR
jgi:hypothetical protein